MTTITALTCDSGSGTSTYGLTSNDVGVCAHGHASWQQVIIQEPFDPSTLNSDELAGAFGAGFTVLATALVIVWAARQLVKAIRFF